MTITALPPAPSRSSPSDFSVKADAWVAALDQFTDEANALAAAMNLNDTTATSTTSLTIGAGAKSLTVDTLKSYQVGMSVKVAYDSTNWMHGEVTSYNAGTGALVVNVTNTSGSGTHAAWTVTLSGPISLLGITAFIQTFLVNGDARINQRVTNYTLVKDVYGVGADRLYGMATGTAVSAGTFGQTAAANCGVSGYGFKFSGVTITGAGLLKARYRVESADAVRFKNQLTSFSCKVHHDAGVAIDYTVYIRKPTVANNFSAVTDISNSGSLPVPSGAETSLKYESIAMGDCTNGIEIEIIIACGAITAKNFELTELQFELGTVATQFGSLPMEQALALCQRYYEKSYDQTVAPGTINQNGYVYEPPTRNLATETVGFSFAVGKRAIPTVTVFSNITGASGRVSNNGDKVASAAGIGVSRVAYVAITGGATNAPASYHWTAEAEL